MKNLVRGSCLFIISFLFVGAVAWAAPAGAGDRPAAPGLSFLFDKDAFAIPGVQAGPAGSGKISKLSLRLYGGYNYTSTADVSDGVSYFFDLVESYDAEGLGTATGGYNPLHSGFNLGADLIYQLTPSIGVGVGAGYLRSSASSAGTFTQDPLSTDLTSRTMVSAIPIRLGVFFTFPLSPKIDLVANAGAAYYAGLKMDASFGLVDISGGFLDMTYNASQRDSTDIGFHGSLGVEYRFSPTMGFFIEALGRYAKLNNFETATQVYEDEFGSETIEGTLYLYTTGTASMFAVSSTPPSGGTYREPKFDLSGFSLQAGIRVRF